MRPQIEIFSSAQFYCSARCLVRTFTVVYYLQLWDSLFKKVRKPLHLL